MTSIVLLIKYAHMACCMSRSACRVMHECPCHHLFVGFPVDGHKCHAIAVKGEVMSVSHL